MSQVIRYPSQPTGGGTPGGSDTQIQYNNAGVFGGIPNFTYNGTNVDIYDSILRIKDNLDPTKIAVFQASGISTATTRTYTFPNESGTLAIGGYGIVHPVSASNTYVYDNIPPSISGSDNTFYGANAGNSVTLGTALVGIGTNSLTAATTASNCIAIGSMLQSLTSGSSAVGIGSGMNAATTAAQVIGIGIGVLDALTTGTQQLAIGVSCLSAATTGNQNLSIGFNNLNAITTQSGMLGIGFGVMSGTTGGSATFAIGQSIGSEFWVPGNVVYIGSTLCNQPLSVTSTISDAIVIGTQIFTGQGSPTVSSTFAIGQQIFTQDDVTTSTVLALGTGIGNAGLSSFSTSVMIGFNMFDGFNNSMDNCISIGTNLFTGASQAFQGTSTIMIGQNMGGLTSNPYTGDTNIFIGLNQCGIVESAINCVVITTSGASNLLDGVGHILIGNDTGTGISGGTFSVSIGPRSMQNCTAPDQSIAIGRGAFQGGTTLSFGTAIGPNTFQTASSVTDSVAIGSNVFQNAAGSGLLNCYSIGTSTGSSCDTNVNIILFGTNTDASSSSSSDEMCVGGDGDPISTVFWGQGGASTASPVPVTQQNTPAAGSNIAGSDAINRPGNGTGTGGSGKYRIQTAPSAASSSTPNTMADAFAADKNGNLESPRVHNNTTSTATGHIRSGTYTPTLTGVANVSASTARKCSWLQVGAVVTVAGQLDIDPTTTLTLTQLGISLPVASNLGTAFELGGTGISKTNNVGTIEGDAANNRAQLAFSLPGDVTNQTVTFSFSYEIV